MFLRRITEHVKAQNWTAVALDFVIVVVGVLIALQVDNWNSWRQTRQLEREVLQAFAVDLQANIDHFNANIEWDRGSITACDQVLNALEVRREWSDEDAHAMGYCRGWTSPYLNSFAFSRLQRIGADLIVDRTLRRVITELYENHYRYLLGDTDRTFWDYQSEVIMPTMFDYVQVEKGGADMHWRNRSIRPRDYAHLHASDDFETMILGKRSLQVISISDQNRIRDETAEVLRAITEELAK